MINPKSAAKLKLKIDHIDDFFCVCKKGSFDMLNLVPCLVPKEALLSTATAIEQKSKRSKSH